MIGQLYNAANVVVGQAACMVAPANTAVPNIALVNQSTDPFDFSLWDYYAFTVGTATSLTFSINGQTSASVTVSGLTAAQIKTAIGNLTSVGAANVFVTGTAGSFQIAFTEAALGYGLPSGTLTKTDTGGVSTLIGGLWTPVGATDQGWKWGAAKTVQDINIEEQTTPVATTINSQKITIEGALSEDISRTLALAFNMTNTYTANGAGIAGYETLLFSDTPIQYAVALIMANQLGKARWLYIPQVTSLANVDVSLRRSAAKRMYSVSFSSTCATTAIQLQNVLQNGT